MGKKKKKHQTAQQKYSTRQERLLTTSDRLQVPVVVAVQLLAGILQETTLDHHPDRAIWRTEYQEESTLRRTGTQALDKQLKQRQAGQIVHLFGVTWQDALAVLEGHLVPATLLTRPQGLWATYHRLQVPAVIAVQLLAGVLDEAALEQNPLRSRLQLEYQEELTLNKTSPKKLKHRRAKQIARAFNVPENIARQVLNGTTKASDLLQITQERERKRQEEALHERQKVWLSQGVTVLQGLGLPEAMARALLDLPPGKTQSRWDRGLGMPPLQIELESSPALAATDYWLKVLYHSGFTTAEALIESWQRYRVWTVGELRQAEQRQIKAANAGLLPERVAVLCAAEQIEDTLHKLFYLNHWAKARYRLLYTDRQGLYQVKARLLQEACQLGHLKTVSYVSSSAPFVPFGESVWVDNAAEWFQEVLGESFTGHPNETSYEMARQLYLQMTGQKATLETVKKLDQGAVEAYIQSRLESLEANAVATRQPIPVSELKALFLTPSDLPTLAYNENGDYRFGRFSPDWDDLNEGDLRTLDPEGLSLIGFRYESPTARYLFHLPLRIAERFVGTDELEGLRESHERTREAGEFYGREITEAESLAYPILRLLAELGVDIDLVCPQGLIDKAGYIAEKRVQQAWFGYALYDEEEDFADEFLKIDSPARRKKKEQN